MTPGDRIKILRVLAGLTQDDLTRRAGGNRAAISNWEGGHYNPSVKGATSVARALGCSPGYLLFGDCPVTTVFGRPAPPKAPKYLPDHYTDIKNLFPEMCCELGLSAHLFYGGEVTRVVLRSGSVVRGLLCFEEIYSRLLVGFARQGVLSVDEGGCPLGDDDDLFRSGPAGRQKVLGWLGEVGHMDKAFTDGYAAAMRLMRGDLLNLPGAAKVVEMLLAEYKDIQTIERGDLFVFLNQLSQR